jgi:putative membrane protein
MTIGNTGWRRALSRRTQEESDVRKIALVFAAAGTAALATGCATRPDPIPVPMVDPASPLAAPTYMRMAASADLFEIQSSQLALQMSSNPAVRGFAQMLISDHTRMSSQMISAAQSAGLMPPPPALEPHHQQMLDQLRMAAPGTFDMAFQNAQVAAHQEALTLHQNYANGGDHPTLRAVAGQAVPVIQAHLNHAQMLAIAPPAPPPPAYRPPRPGERG